MKDLNLIERNGIFYADSREVAEMTEKQHKHLMRDIKGYVEIIDRSKFGLVDNSDGDAPKFEDDLTNSNFRTSDFFIPDTYIDSKGESRPRYLLTRLGCDVVANKMSGAKGVLFTAAYVTRFNQMERQFQPTLTPSTRPRYRARMISTAVRDVDATAKAIMKAYGVKEGMAHTIAISMVEKEYAIDLDPIKKLAAPAKHNIGSHTPTGIGMRMGGKKAEEVNLMLERLGLQERVIDDKGRKEWRLTELGKQYGEALPYNSKSGHSGYQIKWHESVISLLETEVAL